MLEMLLRNGSNPNHSDSKGITPLHLASYMGQDDNVEILLKYKADPNKQDIYGSKNLILNIWMPFELCNNGESN